MKPNSLATMAYLAAMALFLFGAYISSFDGLAGGIIILFGVGEFVIGRVFEGGNNDVI